MDALYRRIRALRDARGLSLREAADRSGGRISHAHLRALEIGHDTRSKNQIRPTPDTLRVVAEVYNGSYEELMQLAGYIPVVPAPDAEALASRWPNLSPDRRRRAADLERDAKAQGIEMHLGRGLTNEEFDSLVRDTVTFAAFIAKQRDTN